MEKRSITVRGLTAVGEAAAGLILLVYPPVVFHLLFASASSGPASVMSRLAGMALIGLGAACWPGRSRSFSLSRALFAMATYSLLVAVYFLVLGIARKWVGPLLWPAAVLHAVLTLVLARAWLGNRDAREHLPARQG